MGSDETPGADPIETTGAEHRTERWSAAGLWDPEAPDAQVRGALLDCLESLGANVERMARAEAEGELVALGLDMLLEDGGLTVEQLATRMGAPVDEVVAAYRLVGVEVNDPAAPMFEEAEIDFVALLTSTAGTFPDAATREILRALSTALSGLSAAAISAFVGSVEDDLAGAGDPVAQARVTREAGLMGLDLAGGLRPLLRHHLRQGVRRQREGTHRSGDRLTIVTAVGFVDLVGYTARTVDMDPEDLIGFIGSFRERTHEIVLAGGGQVVKHIGDEIMISAVDLAGVCRIALALLDGFDEIDTTPRGGVAAGRVVARHGDLYGPVVNLASRLADIAVPGEVLAPAERVTSAVEPDAGAEDLVFVPAGRRQLKGFDRPVAVVTVERPR